MRRTSVAAPRQLRGRPKANKLKLIAETGYGHADNRPRAREAGFDEHLIKPVDLPLLNAFLREAVRAVEGEGES